MAKRKLIDSHIHLWPQETANEAGHSWMTPGMPLAKPHLLSDYRRASRQDVDYTSDVEVDGVVYIETDVRYDPPTGEVSAWAKGPLDEITFLRNLVEGRYNERHGKLLQGLIPWAPMGQPLSTLDDYLRLAEEKAGEMTWRRIKGFRFLLQFIVDRERFKSIVLGYDFINNLTTLGRRGFSFDIGVDQRSGGVWQLEIVAKAMQEAQRDVPESEKVTFIVNHLCKPDFVDQGSNFGRWCDAISSMSKLSRTFMKLSGAFSELSPELTEPAIMATRIKPWVAHVVKCFGPKRIMFGSDWPVCNMNGPLKEDSWIAWKDVVELVLDDPTYELSGDDKDCIWRRNAEEAYNLK